MKLTNRRIYAASFTNAFGVFLYTLAVAWFMTYASDVFGHDPDFLAPFVFLMTFVLSAAVVSSLIFGWPILLWIQGERRAGIRMLAATIGFLFLLTFVAMLLNLWL